MGFALPEDSGYVDVAVKIDSALEMTDAQWEAYVENPIDDNLVCKPGKVPTKLRLRKVLPWSLSKKIEDSKIDMRQDRDGDKVTQVMQPKLSWMYEEVRCALVDIINPPDCDQPVTYERDAEGGASFNLASKLLELGVMMDLYNARKNAIKGGLKPANKKK